MDELLWIAVIGFGSQVTAQLVAAFFAYAAARKIEENTKLTAETHAIVNSQRETMVARSAEVEGLLRAAGFCSRSSGPTCRLIGKSHPRSCAQSRSAGRKRGCCG